jgi:hypothetical protein
VLIVRRPINNLGQRNWNLDKTLCLVDDVVRKAFTAVYQDDTILFLVLQAFSRLNPFPPTSCATSINYHTLRSGELPISSHLDTFLPFEASFRSILIPDSSKLCLVYKYKLFHQQRRRTNGGARNNHPIHLWKTAFPGTHPFSLTQYQLSVSPDFSLPSF